jgi:hypothetical protein
LVSTVEIEVPDPGSPWGGLGPGDSFEVKSFSGHLHSLTFLSTKERTLYVRLEGGKLGRLDSDRVDWSTLETKEHGDACLPGDEVLVCSNTGGHEYRGVLAEAITDSLQIVQEGGKRVSLVLVRADPASFRLLMPASRVHTGDEFCVESLSGRSYRGVAIEAGATHLRVKPHKSETKVRMKLDHLALPTLRILVPISLSLLGCSPVG